MPSTASLQFLILLTILIPIQCQFEFNDQQAVYDLIIDAVPICEVGCVAIIRPNNQNPQQKLAIDRLTEGLAKETNWKYGNRRPGVMSYTTKQYAQIYMNPSMRNKDTCIYWITVVLVSDSTAEQLTYFSANSQFFNSPYWILFANRTEHATIFQNVNIRLNTYLYVVQDKGNGLLNASVIGKLGIDVGYLLWTKKGGFVPGSDNIYQKPTGLTIKMGTLQFPPYLKLNRDQRGQITSVTGFYGDLWNDIQSMLKFNSVYIEPKEGIFGSYNENGYWTGLYGMIAKNEVDILLNEMTITVERNDIVDFLFSIERTKYKIFYKKDGEIFDWLKVFRPLDYLVWIALVNWIIVGGTATYFVNTAEKNNQNPRRHFSLITCMYFVLRALCNQGYDQVGKLLSLRIVFLTAYFTAVVILTSYSASLISVLTVKTPVEPFNDLPDILSTDYKVVILSNSTDYDFFEKTTNPVHRKIFETSVIKTESFEDYHKAMEYTCKNRKTVFFGTLSIAQNHYNDLSCVLLPLKSEISFVSETIAIAKYSQFRQKLREQLSRMIENGLVDRYKQLYLQNAAVHPVDKDIGISLIDVGAIFIYLGIMHVLSVVIFCLELLSWKHYLKKMAILTERKKKSMKWFE